MKIFIQKPLGFGRFKSFFRDEKTINREGLTLCLADAIHNFKWVKIIQIWQNGG